MHPPSVGSRNRPSNPWIKTRSTSEQALAMADARARFIQPIHHRIFLLSNEPLDDPIQRLEKALDDAPRWFALCKIEETFEVPGVSAAIL